MIIVDVFETTIKSCCTMQLPAREEPDHGILDYEGVTCII